MRIALILDNPFRDLPGLVLTALELCRRGATCYLVPARLRYHELFALAPDFVLLNNLRTDKESIAQRLLSAGISLGVLDTEGGVFVNLERYAADLVRAAAIRQGVSCFCSWGPRLADYAVQKQWFSRSQVQVTGVPRFDFYAEPWREAALRLTPDAAGFPSPRVLINSNFSLANPLYRTPEEAAEVKRLRWNREPAAVERELAIERESMEKMIGLAARLSDRLPDLTFIYRPHPFENPDTYRDRLPSRPNLHLVKRGAVDGWILRARALIQRGCSTAIEATLAGVPALAPSWISTPYPLEAVEAVSLPCACEEELAAQLTAAAAGRDVIPEAVRSRLQTVLSDWFFAVDGQCHQRVADAVMDALDSRPPRPSLPYCRRALDGLAGDRVTWKDRARALARRALRRPLTWSFRHWRDMADLSWDRSQCYFGAGEVRAAVQALQPVAPRLATVQVSSALERGEYRFPCPAGRSVVLAPG